MLKLRFSVSICVFIFALSCRVTADAQDGSASLLYCDSDIRNFSLTSRMDSILMSGIQRPRIVDYHLKNKVFFWSDSSTFINTAPLWQEGARPSVFMRGVNSEGLAVDWIHNFIYWTDYTKRAIDLSRLDGSMVKTVLKEEGIRPWSIVLNPAEGFMFWSGGGNIRKIERCNMDGTSRKVIVKDDISSAYGLTIDLESRRIFWVDFLKYYLSSAKFDGSHRRNLITQLKNPKSIDVYGQHVYFVTQQAQHHAVYKASKVDGSGLTKVFDGESTLNSLKVFHPSKQLEGYNVCGDNNGGCSHLCLPTSGHTFSCACPNDRNMSSDHFNCLNPDGSAVTTTTLTTNAPSSQLPFTVFQNNFTSSTRSAATTPTLTTNAPSSQLPFTVFQNNFTSSTEMTTTENPKASDDDFKAFTAEENKNVDATVGTSGSHGTLAVVIASVTLIAVVGIMIYIRQFLRKNVSTSGIPNPVQKKSCEENLYMEESL